MQRYNPRTLNNTTKYNTSISRHNELKYKTTINSFKTRTMHHVKSQLVNRIPLNGEKLHKSQTQYGRITIEFETRDASLYFTEDKTENRRPSMGRGHFQQITSATTV